VKAPDNQRLCQNKKLFFFIKQNILLKKMPSSQCTIGDKIPAFDQQDIFGNRVSSSDYENSLIMISFYRCAECMFCSLRMNQLIQKAAEYEEKGLKMIAIWQSPTDDVLKYVDGRHHPLSLSSLMRSGFYTNSLA
jgi:hypothetical protein